MVEEPYQISGPCSFVRVEYFLPQGRAQPYRWQKSGTSSLCYWKGRFPLRLCCAQSLTCYDYRDDLLQKDTTYSVDGERVLEETHYYYDSGQRLRQQKKIHPGEPPEVTNFFYNNQNMLCEKHTGPAVVRYHYNELGEVVLQRDYQRDQLTLVHRKWYRDGFLVRHDEFRPNGQFQRRHSFRRNSQGLLLAYSLMSGKKIILRQLEIAYPVFYRNDWLEQIVVQLRRRGSRWERVPLKRLKRGCCYPVTTGSLG